MLEEGRVYKQMLAEICSSIETKEKLKEHFFLAKLFEISKVVSSKIQLGGKLMLCGNGGSAADAQHLAAELLVRLKSNVNRGAIPALALAMDTSTLTACGNDYSFDDIYGRMVSALGNSSDVLMVITTSGNSQNILNALDVAKERGVLTVGFLGATGGAAMELCDYSLLVPGRSTARVQEAHIMLGHMLMGLVEDMLLDVGYIIKKTNHAEK